MFRAGIRTLLGASGGGMRSNPYTVASHARAKWAAGQLRQIGVSLPIGWSAADALEQLGIPVPSVEAFMPAQPPAYFEPENIATNDGHICPTCGQRCYGGGS